MRLKSFTELAQVLSQDPAHKDHDQKGSKTEQRPDNRPRQGQSPSKRPQKATKRAPAPTAKRSGSAESKPEFAAGDPDEMVLFKQAMQGVEPLKNNGRQIVRGPQGCSPPRPNQSERQARRYLQALVQGRVEFEFEHTSEFIEGHVRGLDQRIVRRLKDGQFSYQAHLDLHGANAEGGRLELLRFMRSNYLQGHRCLLVIPGRGRNSPDGRGVLRIEIQDWLTQDPLKRIVLAFCSALPRHGGAGALYVLLRKYKKSQGKILWQRQGSD